MLARIIYRVRSWSAKRALERANPVLRELNQAEAKARKAHGRTRQIQARKRELMLTALGWRGMAR